MFESLLQRILKVSWIAALALSSLLVSPMGLAVQLSDARLWPSPDYTRLTLEAPQPIAFNYFKLANPERLVLDMEGLERSAALNELASKLSANDPYVASVRLGVNRPGVMRLVLELKTQIKPSVFQLKPLGEYGHRLVVDLYPEQPPDALAQLGLGRKPEPVAVTAEAPVPKFTPEESGATTPSTSDPTKNNPVAIAPPP